MNCLTVLYYYCCVFMFIYKCIYINGHVCWYDNMWVACHMWIWGLLYCGVWEHADDISISGWTSFFGTSVLTILYCDCFSVGYLNKWIFLYPGPTRPPSFRANARSKKKTRGAKFILRKCGGAIRKMNIKIISPQNKAINPF